MTSVAVASNAGMKSGQMKPPSCDAAKSMPPADATSMRFGADSFVQVMVAWRSEATRSASRVTDTGNATRASAFASVTRVRSTSSAWSLSSAWPSSSMIVAVSPSGSMTTPSWLPDARTSSDKRDTRAERSSSAAVADAVLAYGLMESTSAPVLARTVGMTIDAAPNE